MKIEAAVARRQAEEFSVETLDIDDPRNDEVLVRISGVGVCHTDLAVRDGVLPIPLPAVLGHEGSGTVVAVGSNVTKVKVGDHVVLTFRSCGHCHSCEDDDPAYCQQFNELNFAGVRSDGSHSLRSEGEAVSGNFFGQSSFASYALAYEANIVKVDERAPLPILGPLGCGVQTGAGAVMRSLSCEQHSSILVLGAGTVGLSAVMAAVVQGCSHIIVSDPMEARRELALALGATHVVDPMNADLGTTVRNFLPHGVDYALDTTGNVAVLQSTLSCMGHLGTLGLVGVPNKPGVTIPVDPLQLMSLGLTLKGIVEGDSDPDVFIPELEALFLNGKFPFDKLVRTYPLSEINRAVTDQARGFCVKPVLIPAEQGEAIHAV